MQGLTVRSAELDQLTTMALLDVLLHHAGHSLEIAASYAIKVLVMIYAVAVLVAINPCLALQVILAMTSILLSIAKAILLFALVAALCLEVVLTLAATAALCMMQFLVVFCSYLLVHCCAATTVAWCFGVLVTVLGLWNRWAELSPGLMDALTSTPRHWSRLMRMLEQGRVKLSQGELSDHQLQCLSRVRTTYEKINRVHHRLSWLMVLPILGHMAALAYSLKYGPAIRRLTDELKFVSLR